MPDWDLYHGTSSKAYDSILAYGFILTEPRYHNFLAPQGIYFIPNRPLLARRFANNAARSDLSFPLVLNIRLRPSINPRILDLTTDDGLHIFYRAHKRMRGLLEAKKPKKVGPNTPLGYKEYMQSIYETNVDIYKRLDAASKEQKQHESNFNWDTLAIQLVIDEYQVQLIVAAISEGTTFGFTFHKHQPSYATSAFFHGIRCRDHLEVCVVDLNVIDMDSISVRESNKDVEIFDQDYLSWITSLEAQDAEPK